MKHTKSKIIALAKETKFFDKTQKCIFDSFLIDEPYMTKQDIQMFSNELIIPRKLCTGQGQMVRIRTSGSTGQVVEVLWKPQDYVKSNLCLWRLRKKYYNINASDIYLTFHIAEDDNLGTRADVIKKRNSVSVNKSAFSKDDFEQILLGLQKHSIKWIFTQPSVLLLLMHELKERNMTVQKIFPNLKHIELNGEVLIESERKAFLDFFDVPVANLYGASEVNGIAYQCPAGHLHILEDNVFVQLFDYEVISTDCYNGEIAVTSLHNSLMPLVSYALGDKISIQSSDNCKYSRAPVIDVLIGRTSDTVYLSDNITISSYNCLKWIESINAEYGNPILEYKVKKGRRQLTFVLYLKEEFGDWSKTITERLKEKIQRVCPECSVAFECVERPINLSENGKVKQVNRDKAIRK